MLFGIDRVRLRRDSYELVKLGLEFGYKPSKLFYCVEDYKSLKLILSIRGKDKVTREMFLARKHLPSQISRWEDVVTLRMPPRVRHLILWRNSTK